MKKDNLKLKHGYSKDDEEIEVFYLDSYPPEYRNNLSSEDLYAELVEEEAHLCAPSLFKPNKEGEVTEIKGCCPAGHKGHEGATGLYEEELVIKGVLDHLGASQLNIASETARVFLAREIAKDLRKANMLKDKYTQF